MSRCQAAQAFRIGLVVEKNPTAAVHLQIHQAGYQYPAIQYQIGCSGVRPTGVRPTGVRPTGVRPTGVRPTGVPVSDTRQ